MLDRQGPDKSRKRGHSGLLVACAVELSSCLTQLCSYGIHPTSQNLLPSLDWMQVNEPNELDIWMRHGRGEEMEASVASTVPKTFVEKVFSILFRLAEPVNQSCASIADKDVDSPGLVWNNIDGLGDWSIILNIQLNNRKCSLEVGIFESGTRLLSLRKISAQHYHMVVGLGRNGLSCCIANTSVGA